MATPSTVGRRAGDPRLGASIRASTCVPFGLIDPVIPGGDFELINQSEIDERDLLLLAIL